MVLNALFKSHASSHVYDVPSCIRDLIANEKQ